MAAPLVAVAWAIGLFMLYGPSLSPPVLDSQAFMMVLGMPWDLILGPAHCRCRVLRITKPVVYAGPPHAAPRRSTQTHHATQTIFHHLAHPAIGVAVCKACHALKLEERGHDRRGQMYASEKGTSVHPQLPSQHAPASTEGQPQAALVKKSEHRTQQDLRLCAI